jgi:ATP-dependent Clp protease ATP-binding subunit ClpC
MFERYTEKARRVIFFARHEASELGALAIEPHHILLGLMREDQQLIRRFCTLTPTPIDDIGNKIRSSASLTAKLPTSVDMPLSVQARNVLMYAADESKRLNHKHIGTEHLFLGILRAESMAAEILVEYGAGLNIAREELRDKTKGEAGFDIDKEGGIEELRRLAAEARNLATAIVRKAERIEAICDQLTKGSSN